MSNFADTYEIDGELTEDGIDFIFISDGKKEIPKMIRYSYIMDFQGDEVFNLGFGDYNYRKRSYSDNIIASNGDPYTVFHTVLATIPLFFQAFENAVLIIQGSDSTPEFLENCRNTCVRKCLSTECKKAHRRINIYRNYLDKNFTSLSDEYTFFGSLNAIDNQLAVEGYLTERKYQAILLKKCNFII